MPQTLCKMLLNDSVVLTLTVLGWTAFYVINYTFSLPSFPSTTEVNAKVFVLCFAALV